MRLHVLSDLHLEFARFLPPKVEADVVVLAGDVHPGLLGLKWIRDNYRDVPVVYVLGNHEFYAKNIPNLTVELKERAKDTNVFVLENDAVQIGDVTFLGATLWTDLELYEDFSSAQSGAAQEMTDYRRIRLAPRYSRLKPRDTRKLHLESMAWMKNQVENQQGRKFVIVSHHAPSQRSVKPDKLKHQMNPAYVSNLDRFVESSKARLWVHGHIHHCSDYRIGETRVLANPRGYPDEPDAGFNPALVVEV